VRFRRVESEQAGPAALGILVPPGRRTFVILRPRSLPWDLVLCRTLQPPTFRDLAHDEASACAQALYRGLRDWAAGTEAGSLEAAEADGRFLVRLALGPYTLLACPRRPGQPYAPLSGTEEEAWTAAAALRAVLHPQAEQELYFNLRFFGRQPPGGE